jgi:FkbM family methyltransferase
MSSLKEISVVPKTSVVDTDMVFEFEVSDKKYQLVYPNDDLSKGIYMELFHHNCYPLFPFKNFKPKTIMDVGGFVGDSALYFHIAYPEATIHVYEPAQTNLSYLMRNVKDFPKIQPHPYGLSNKSGELTMHLAYSGALNSIYANSKSNSETETIQLKSVAEELSSIEKEISILKVDIEGGEVKVIGEFLKNVTSDIPIIYLEYHSEKDRLALDRLLKDKYILSYGNIRTQNCGTLVSVLQSFKDEGYNPEEPIESL